MTPFFYKVVYVNDGVNSEKLVGGFLYAKDYVDATRQLQDCFGDDLVKIVYLEDGMEDDLIIVPANLVDQVREAYFKDL